MKVVYSDGYYLKLGEHVFPAVKYRRVKERLLEEKIVEPSDLREPEPATDDDLLLVHTPSYIQKLKMGTFSPVEVMRHEVPYSRELVDAFVLGAGGSILAARLALDDGIAVNLGGGFHHAFPDHGEGFCLIHDVAVAIRRMQKERKIEKAMVVDCDVHQGNGTAAIFKKDPDVFTLSLHQLNNYPTWKPPSSLDVDLSDGVQDAEYLEKLKEGLDSALRQLVPDMLFYVAGADPYKEDQLGGLGLTLEGLVKRDVLVLRTARQRKIPAHVTFAGGYAVQVEDTVTIHANTVRVAKEVFGGAA
ncbi:MAG TPA: histone deacetylase [Candidatus Polarisedimenticolia bacterium]|nr:histone deacetylase [Candidatus Polarisedimenticolia bacterium]